jgi:sarcosine oxidase subunit alpha
MADAGSGRLPAGGCIDRSRPLNFRFNGRPYQGYQGDTLASALLANGVKVLGRSFKYHRPRGIFTSGEEEPCALVETGEGDARIPTCRAPLVPLSEGLVARSQTGWPSVGLDLGRVIDFTHALWPAGFYNKTFKWPSWHFWEGMIRKSAGLGRPLGGPDPDHYEQVNAHCDLLICGAGPAGLLSALAAGRSGLRVIVAEQSPDLGGVLKGENYLLDGAPGLDWVHRAQDELESLPDVLLLPNTTVSGVYDHNVTTLLQTGSGTAWRECLWTVRPRHILVATGAIEQGLIFPHNDRPGVMLAGAVRQYLNQFAVKAGKQAVVATNNDSAYQTALDLARNEIPVNAVVDARREIDQALRKRLSGHGIPLLTGARIGHTRGAKGIRSVRIEDLSGKHLGRYDCDLLAVSGGWAPRVHLLAHARGTLRFDEDLQSFLPDALPTDVSVTGAAAGQFTMQGSFTHALAETAAICDSLGARHSDIQAPEVSESVIEPGRVAPQAFDKRQPRQWIDLAHDVTLGDAELAVREGYVSVEHFKRYTTVGMSVDQGKTGNLNAFIALGALTGRTTGEVGTTTFRPPYAPVTLGAVAGRNIGEFYAPRRFLPAHTVHASLNGQFEDYGWQRPDCYPQPGESVEAAIRREVLAVRNAVGVFDNSPIGKLEVRGPDAAEFLNRLYINNVLTLEEGHVRYGLMLNENGVIIDDGVFVRLAADHFLVNTTSGGVARIAAMMEEWLQCDWRDLRVLVDDTTTQWANFTIAGPRARQVILALGTDIDVSARSLPHMSAATGTIAGLAARIVRVSFSGEASFEVNVPARSACGFLEAVLKAGRPLGIAPYGVEPLMVLRTEKGYLHVGSDTDGSSTPDDVGWGRVARAKQADYIGKRSLFRPANLESGRKQFVGLEPLDPDQRMQPGAHLLTGKDRKPPAETDGWVTSACFSPTLERTVALGVLRDGRQKMGEILTACDEDRLFSVKVVPPSFYDPDNLRLKN